MHTCEFCFEPITMLDAQTSSGGSHAHTRCFNEYLAASRAAAEAYDDGAEFPPAPAYRDLTNVRKPAERVRVLVAAIARQVA